MNYLAARRMYTATLPGVTRANGFKLKAFSRNSKQIAEAQNKEPKNNNKTVLFRLIPVYGKFNKFKSNLPSKRFVERQIRIGLVWEANAKSASELLPLTNTAAVAERSSLRSPHLAIAS